MQPHILNDQGIGMHPAVQVIQEFSGLIQFIGFDQGIDGDKHPGPFGMGQLGQPGQLFEGKIFGFHAGGKLFQTAINRIGPGGQRS